ncbi:hypothetical protein Sjap_019658 [Stephania japonica]|uniref:Uncharacterized protein n=1 Tax=Stephania japonica TaxID=461633 RepID=A0AAP0HZX5_9MAGN
MPRSDANMNTNKSSELLFLNFYEITCKRTYLPIPIKKTSIDHEEETSAS